MLSKLTWTSFLRPSIPSCMPVQFRIKTWTIYYNRVLLIELCVFNHVDLLKPIWTFDSNFFTNLDLICITWRYHLKFFHIVNAYAEVNLLWNECWNIFVAATCFQHLQYERQMYVTIEQIEPYAPQHNRITTIMFWKCWVHLHLWSAISILSRTLTDRPQISAVTSYLQYLYTSCGMCCWSSRIKSSHNFVLCCNGSCIVSWDWSRNVTKSRSMEQQTRIAQQSLFLSKRGKWVDGVACEWCKNVVSGKPVNVSQMVQYQRCA